MLLLLAVLDLSQSVPPPEPRGWSSVHGLFTSDDYPAVAVANNWQGDVRVRLTISPEGNTKSCRIIQSSGYEALDVKTCEIFLVRARFAPARDAYDRPVEGTYETKVIRWRLAAEVKPNK